MMDGAKTFIAMFVAILIAIPLLANLQSVVFERTNQVWTNETKTTLNGTALTLSHAPIPAELKVTNATSTLLDTNNYTLSGTTFTLKDNRFNNTALRYQYTYNPETNINESSKGITLLFPVMFGLLIIAAIIGATFL